MRCGSKMYKIVPKNRQPPDLMHLEKKLKEIGYSCNPSLKELQDGLKSLSDIEPLKSYESSFVRKNNGAFELVVFYDEEELLKFAEEYNPIPLENKN
jgi:hypothetical protein